MIRCVVLDFDGTLTDAEAHAPSFYAEERACLAEMLGRPLAEIESRWDEWRERYLQQPTSRAWTQGDIAVVPACADPYLLGNSITKEILAEGGSLDGERLFQAVYEVHRVAYGRTESPFRSDARELLEFLLAKESLAVFVDTNPHSEAVGKRLESLQLTHASRLGLRGNAQKFVVAPPTSFDDHWHQLPKSLDVEGLERSIALHRGRYFDILQGIWTTSHARPSNTLVCGDIFELDLAMPWALGAHVHLVLRKGTLAHERGAAVSFPRSQSSMELLRIRDRILSIEQ